MCRFYLLTLKTFEKGVASTQASANLTAITLGIRKDRGQLHTAPSTTHQAPPKILDYWEIVDLHLLISQIFLPQNEQRKLRIAGIENAKLSHPLF